MLECGSPIIAYHLCPLSRSVRVCGDFVSFDRRNEHVRMNFLGMFPFTAPYLPWVLLTFSALLGSPLGSDMVRDAWYGVYNR